MSTSTFEFDTLLFRPAAMASGCSSVHVACGEGLTRDVLRDAMSEQHASIVRAGRLAVNGGYVDGSTVIDAGDRGVYR